ncbi:Blue-light-activated histidine kinase 1 [Tsuneonella dongtanensis]|uniref:histidine kinase n=1 Tax=Tsuneonella dongtanensis TaxID=692370 RepID=A0A1B2A929_9SPHN|nr:sensor histidine kinase [Tsuneonella dongtanensis]ANY18683.1 Blue-light-activated histidine kinase 1 [Tsuneonella dongtanensis]
MSLRLSGDARLEHVIEYGNYMPHGMCLLWQPWLVLLWAGSDLLIFLSYTAIPLALITVLRKRKDVPQARLVVLFASFILLCGLTHMLGIVTLWYPIYPYVGWVKLATGLVSVTTAVVLFRLIPDLIALPSPGAMNAANTRLIDEIAAHQATLATLERQVEERTKELKEANAVLAVQTREAVHRSGNLLSVVNSLAVQTAKGTQRTEEFLGVFLGRVRALANATKSIERKNESSIELDAVVDEGLGVFEEIYGERFTYAGPPLVINPEAAQQISLALHELATNTQKYGLSAAETAHVEVSWDVKHSQFELVWLEYGAPALSDEPKEEGFGSKLLTRVVPTMLRGQASRTIEQGKLVYRLTAPLEAVVASEEGGDSDRMAARIVDESFGLDSR